jgi:dTDP-4-dehydrorhamnose reductase
MTTEKLRILIIGVSGMLGNTLFRYFSDNTNYEALGTLRNSRHTNQFDKSIQKNLIHEVDVLSFEQLVQAFQTTKPNLVINCVGIVKQLSEANDALISIPTNSLLPHRLAQLARTHKARLIHFSTDCVFSGKTGNYIEEDTPDAMDLYGRSKLLGEVHYENTITLRTSIIGHELNGSRSLINWFLSQTGSIRGYTRAIFSGLPCIEIARIIEKFIIPHPMLYGLYHLSANPISKYELLNLVKSVYKKEIEIYPDQTLEINRHLNSFKLINATGYKPIPWIDMINNMHKFR